MQGPKRVQWEGLSCLQCFPGEVQMAQGGTWSWPVQSYLTPVLLNSQRFPTLEMFCLWTCSPASRDVLLPL